MNEIALSLLLALGGAIMTVHCSRMTWREARSGVAKARYGDYRRSAQPAAFWTVVVLNAFAASMGAVFLLVGLFAVMGSAE